MLGVLAALTSALIWGSGDFAGGMAARRINQFQALATAALSGLLILAGLAAVRGEALPSPASIAWACAAGIGGAVGIAALYRGLSIGNAAVVAPTSAVVGAALPVFFSALLEGIPGTAQIAGFLAGLGGIWLVSRASPGAADQTRPGLGLAFLAGLGFGGFFIMIAQVQPDLVFTPLIAAKAVALSLALLMLLIRRLDLQPALSHPVAWAAGLLDAGGNVFYLVASQFTRVDVAAVLSSMYPAATVILASLILKERVSRAQWLGVVLCLCAVALIAL
jgi:drug/metabolite transporter (DMT)-like permease